MIPLSKRIEDAQKRIVDLEDQLKKHLETTDDENPDDAATAITEDLTTKIDAQQKSLESLQRAERQIARSVDRGSNLPALHQDDRGSERGNDRSDRGSEQAMTVRNPRPFAMAMGPKPKPFDFLIKAITTDIKHFGEGRKRPFNEVLRETYGDAREYGEMVRMAAAHFVTKAASIPADTTTTHWATDLVQTVIGDFIQSLIPHSVYPGLSAKGGSFTYGRNGVISLPARNTATTVGGAFIAQGAPIPVKQGAFTSITLTPKKMGVITTLTREITEHSTPSIEAIIKEAILEDTGIAIDTVLLDGNPATTTRPAGLQNGLVTLTPTAGGGGAAPAGLTAFVGDLRLFVSTLIAGTKGNLRSPVWIMNPGDVLIASLLQTSVGETPFREELSGGTLLGYPIIQSTNGVADNMEFMDAADFITATGDAPQFSVSDQAVLHMEDTTPAQITSGGATPAFASPVRSLWQTDSIAIRMIMDINWAMRRPAVVAFMAGMTWN